jgi:hypothetical protein
VVCRGSRNDFNFSDSDVTAAAVSFISAIPLWRFGNFIIDSSKQVSDSIASDNPNLRYTIIETLGCLQAPDDVVNLCVSSAPLVRECPHGGAKLEGAFVIRSKVVH